jgi:hypothetical protein
MIQGYHDKEKPYLYTILFAIALISFYPLMFTGIATADDLHFYIISIRGIVWEDTLFFAKVTGRFYFYIVKVFYSLPYFIDHPAFLKACQLVPIFLCMFVFWRILKLVSGSDSVPVLFTLIFLATMQISRHTSLFVAYPLYFTLSFFLILLSFHQLLIFFRNHRKRHLIASVILYIAGLLFYEVYLFYIFFVGMAILADRYLATGNNRDRIKQAAWWMAPYLVIVFLYVTAYFLYRFYYPPIYEGSSFSKNPISFSSFLYVIWRLSVTAFPLTVYETSHQIFSEKSELITGYSPVLLNLILTARVEWIVKGILVAFLGYRLLGFIEGIHLRKVLAFTLISVMMVFLPHILLGLTDKYNYYVGSGSMIGYITTFFSFFGVTLLLAGWIAYVAGKLSVSPVTRISFGIILATGLFLCSVLTDFSNYTIARDIRSANLRIYAMDELVKSDAFRAMPPNSPVYARTLYESPSVSAPNITEQAFNWYEYFDGRTGQFYPVGRDDSTFLSYASQSVLPSWYFTMRQAEKSEEISLVMARIGLVKPTDTVVNQYVDTATVLYYSSYKTFTVSFRIRDIQPVRAQIGINHIRDVVSANGHVEITISNTKTGKPATQFTLMFPGIDINSIMVSNMVNKKNPVFYL